MILYGVKLPEIKCGNEIEILKTCRDIHQNLVNRRKRNTCIQEWDKYWVEAYNFIIKTLKGKVNRPRSAQIRQK